MYEYIPAILSVIIAFAAFILSVCAFYINRKSVKFQEKSFEMQSKLFKMQEEQFNMQLGLFKMQEENFKLQEKHFKESLKPHCNIRCTEVNHAICIDVYNSGQGFMIIKKIDITNKEEDESFTAINKLIMENIKLEYYSVNLKDYGVPAGKYAVLIKTARLNNEELKNVRDGLAKYTIYIDYIDAYGNLLQAQKDLSTLYGKEFRRQNGQKTP